jgi:hypothetical protein
MDLNYISKRGFGEIARAIAPPLSLNFAPIIMLNGVRRRVLGIARQTNAMVSRAAYA